MNTELYRILNTIFALTTSPFFAGILDKIDYVGYDKTVYEKGRHYINQYKDADDLEIEFGITDEAINYQDDYAYIYVRGDYEIDTTFDPHLKETINLRLVLCSFQEDIENHSRKLLVAILRSFAENRSILTNVFEFSRVAMNLNKERIFAEETARDNERMTTNNALNLATFDFRLVYSYNTCNV